MKRILYILITLMIILPSTIYAAGNPYPHYETISGTKDKMVNCTWYAWQQAYDKMGVELASMGNAKNWYKKAKSLGYNVGSTPKANSIAVYEGGGYGHVAYVVKVDGEYMTVNEGGVYTFEYEFDEQGNKISEKKVAYNNTGIYENNISTSVVGRPRDGDYVITENTRILTGFIYLDSVPEITTTKKTTTTKKSNSTTTSSTTTTEPTTSPTTTESTTMSTTSTTTKEATELTDKSDKQKLNIESIALMVTSVVVILTIIIMLIIKKKK